MTLSDVAGDQSRWVARFWSKVDRRTPDECWEWLGNIDDAGYGRFFASDGRRFRSHRIAYELLVGPIPDGLVIDHLCRVRHCCNPRHLEPVTSRVNTHRGEAPVIKAWRSDTCMNGHSLTEHGYVQPSTGYRTCRICRADRERRNREAINETRKAWRAKNRAEGRHQDDPGPAPATNEAAGVAPPTAS